MNTEIEDLNNWSQQKSEQFCKVCQIPTRLCCKSCCSTYYCSREHQKIHWKIHKNECFPVKVVKNSKGNRILFATKDLKQGQKILEEDPILVVPNTRSENGITCLGCCKKLTPNTITACIRCGWPLCSAQCEMEYLHTDNECKIFQDQQIQSSLGNLGNSFQTFCEIGVLRILLLKNRDINTWKRLMELDSFKEARQKVDDKMFSISSIIRFIRDDVKLLDVDEDLIDTAFGILRGNSFDTSDYVGFIQCCNDEVRNASLLFPTAILPGVNCIPNAYYSIIGRQEGNIKFSCVATVDIKKDEPISIPYDDDMTGTFLRRRVKESVFYQNCSCKLCSDPTEYFTYISSIKCNDSICKDGNMLPLNPLTMDTEWKCETCNTVIPQLKMLDVIQTAKIRLQSCMNQTSLEESLKSVRGVTKTLLHENHFLVLQTEMEICRRILSVIGIYEMKNITSDYSSILENIIEISQHLLAIADIIRPGYNRTRGRLLYCLQFGLLVSILSEQGQQGNIKITQRMKIKKKLKMEQLFRLQKEAEIILALEGDENSEEFKMLKTLKGELKMAVQTIHNY